MNTTGTVSERLRQLEVAARSPDTTVAGPALRILGHVAQEHLIALATALEEHYAGHGELRAIEETLAGWRRNQAARRTAPAPTAPLAATALSEQDDDRASGVESMKPG